MAADRMRPEIIWIDDSEFTVRDVTFRAAPWERFTSTAERFCVVKRPDLVQNYVDLIHGLAPRAILELGIFAGGSTALLSIAMGCQHR